MGGSDPTAIREKLAQCFHVFMMITKILLLIHQLTRFDRLQVLGQNHVQPRIVTRNIVRVR